MTLIISMKSEQKPYLPLEQVRRFKPYERCGVKRFVPTCVGSIAYLAEFVKRFATVNIKDIVEIRLSYLYQQKHGKWGSNAVGGDESRGLYSEGGKLNREKSQSRAMPGRSATEVKRSNEIPI